MHYLHKPPKGQSPKSPTIVMLHGRGADEHDLFGLSNYIDEQFEIFSLRAPFLYSWGGFAWFDLFEDGSVDEKGFRHSAEEIQQFLAALKTDSVILLGFSMGAIMSYAIALTNPTLCKGIVCLSGFAPVQLENEYKLMHLENLAIFISHGLHDPVIPIASARRTKTLLDTSNAGLTYKEYDMGHEINEECINDVSAWLRTVI